MIKKHFHKDHAESIWNFVPLLHRRRLANTVSLL